MIFAVLEVSVIVCRRLQAYKQMMFCTFKAYICCFITKIMFFVGGQL